MILVKKLNEPVVGRYTSLPKKWSIKKPALIFDVYEESSLFWVYFFPCCRYEPVYLGAGTFWPPLDMRMWPTLHMSTNTAPATSVGPCPTAKPPWRWWTDSYRKTIFSWRAQKGSALSFLRYMKRSKSNCRRSFFNGIVNLTVSSR